MNELIRFFYHLDLYWLGMFVLVVCLICLAIAAFGCLIGAYIKSKEPV